MSREISNNELNLMLSVVKKYYEQGMNQEAIAKEEFISKSSVCRLIKKAVASGYVRFQINYPVESIQPLEDKIKAHFRIDKVFITPSYTDDPAIRMRDTCRGAANDLCELVQPDDIISVSWGRTLDVLSHLLSEELSAGRKCSKVVMMNGSMANDVGSNKASRIIELLADFFAADGYLLPAPLIVDSAYTANATKNDSHIKYVLDFAEQSDIAVFSLGAVGEDSVLKQRGAYSAKDFNKITEGAAVGDIGGHCYNIDGKITNQKMDKRVIGLSLDKLKNKKHRIGIASGKEKAPAIIGALRGGFINGLYIDELTAREVIELLNKKPEYTGGEK